MNFRASENCDFDCVGCHCHNERRGESGRCSPTQEGVAVASSACPDYSLS